MTMRPTLHLVCNAHLDPVWLWEWEEGAAEAISTFRTAADLCQEFDGFIFNHNEAILYRWVEEYEPALFERIQRLVGEGKWHIMGGWYLQPDCNMPSGESFVRQALLGHAYFREKFDADPTTAINFDPFGHTRGLVQILRKCGYDSYLFGRPGQHDCPLPADEFVWVGYDGSEILGSRFAGYNSPLGKAREKVDGWIQRNPGRDFGVLLWGVGNHGGGPSRLDLQRLRDLMAEHGEYQVVHSTPEAYFAELRECRADLPRHDGDLNPWAIGCYTSQVRIKQKHRLLENEVYALEKMAATAAAQGLIAYPADEVREALRDLMTAEFHDILPGSSIQPVEEMSIRLMDHALETVSRAKARAFFALASGQPKAAEGEIPILVYNPHPHPISAIVECEFQLADQNWTDTFTLPVVHSDGVPLPCQVEKEASNLSLDWRKRVVFRAELAPSQMSRFDCRLKVLPRKPEPAIQVADGILHFVTDDLEVIINASTGLIDRYRARGVDTLREGAFQPIVLLDDEDPWGMRGRRFDRVAGAFELMSPEEGTRFSGVTAATLPSVRVVEDGPVRTVVEAVLSYGASFICQRYKLPKRGTEVEVETRVHWNEKDRLLKLSIPTLLEDAEYVGQVAYGRAELPSNGDEAVAQKWVAALSRSQGRAVTCINEGTYGSDFQEGIIRMTLLRSPAYSGHPIHDRPVVPQDRYLPRIDQGERLFRFWLNAGQASRRLARIDREALAKNEKPFALSFFPSGAGEAALPGVVLGDHTVLLTAFKKAEESDDLVIRLFEPTGQARTTALAIPFAGMETTVSLTGFEIKTLRANLKARRFMEVDLLERGL